MWKSIGAAAAFLVINAVAFGADTVTLKGKVTDASGKPIEHATVMVYHAGVKIGYSLFCPSCYADCGKRAFTDASGSYTFTNLNPDLWFELLVVREGYVPILVKKVDPADGRPAVAVLNIRSGNDPAATVRGLVLDPSGKPLRDVVVLPRGVLTKEGSMIGQIPGLDPIVVTNKKGEFEASYNQPTAKMLLLVEARTMAPKFVVMPTGTRRQTVELSGGAVIRGRLVADGKGVGGVEVGLIAKEKGYGPDLTLVGNPFDEIKIGTQADGSFVVTNVPSRVEWYVYGKMESLRTLGATEPFLCATTKDKETVNLGDVQVKPGLRFRGKVILDDGKPIPAGMGVDIWSNLAHDFQITTLTPDGRFEFTGLSAGGYELTVSAKGYSFPNGLSTVPIAIGGDIDNWSIVLSPQGDVPIDY